MVRYEHNLKLSDLEGAWFRNVPFFLRPTINEVFHLKDFSLNPILHRNLNRLGYTEPTPVQAAAIPPALDGRDLIVTAETGSGKTAAFLLPVLERLLVSPLDGVKALVLCPTREMALQVQGQVKELALGTRLRSLAVYGGARIDLQIRSIKGGLDLVVATPGRLLDHLGRGTLELSHLRFLIVDEADRMLDMGFLPDLQRILTYLPASRQTMLFSATMPRTVQTLAERFLSKPLLVTVGRPASPPITLDQCLYPVDRERKTELLLHLLATTETSRVLVFTRTKHRADRLTTVLRRSKIRAACIHGDRSQTQREAALAGFRGGTVKVLVATDIAARGLDIRTVSHVINYDLPGSPEDYIHRIGRTARAGDAGNAWSMVTPDDTGVLRSIENTIGRSLPWVALPEFIRTGRIQGQDPSGQGRAGFRSGGALATSKLNKAKAKQVKGRIFSGIKDSVCR